MASTGNEKRVPETPRLPFAQKTEKVEFLLSYCRAKPAIAGTNMRFAAHAVCRQQMLKTSNHVSALSLIDSTHASQL